jgi:hypothetical protein
MNPANCGKVLAAFNTAARYKLLHARLTMMLEEITRLIDHAQSDGLQAKAQAAIPIWVEWCECVHRHGGEWLRKDLKVLETDLVLTAAAAGCEPWEIMRRVMRLRDENSWNDADVTQHRRASVLDTFNDFAEFKTMETEMWILLEEICVAVDNDQPDGLQAKCEVATQFWEMWLEWRRAHSDGEKHPAELEPRRDPKELQIELLLNTGILGWGPAEIRRRWRQLRDENGWPAESPLGDANARVAEDALYAWMN